LFLIVHLISTVALCRGKPSSSLSCSAVLNSIQVKEYPVVLDNQIVQALIEVGLGLPKDQDKVGFVKSVEDFYGVKNLFDHPEILSTASTTPKLTSELSELDQGFFTRKFNLLDSELVDEQQVAPLQDNNIGGAKGFSDRQILREVLSFSIFKSTPLYFVTADRRLFNGLCRLSAECKDPKRVDLRAYSKKGFTVSIAGGTLIVIPIFP